MRSMKESGIEWIGEIPSDWKLERLQWHLESVNESNNPIQTTQVLSLTNKLGVIPYEEKGNQGNKSKNNYSEYKLAYPNMIVANSMNIIIGSVGLSKYFGCVSPVYYVFRANSNISIEFLNYIFQTVGFQKELRKYANGILEIRLRVSADNILKRQVALPSVKEQYEIVRHLDTKCEKINAAIIILNEQVDTLKRQRESIICEAVTGQKDSSKVMIERPIPWVSLLPKEWKIIPAKYLFENSDIRKQPDDMQLTASQKYGIITQTEYMERENAKIVLATKDLEKWKHVEPNDFVISLRSFQGGLEMSETSGCITWHYVVLKARKEICHRYYKWLFKSSLYINALQGTCNYIRDGQDLRYSNFSQVTLFEPPVKEQEAIADFLDKRCAEIDLIIEKKTKQIEILEAYNKAIIYEYVTGKKEVPTDA